MYPELVYEVTNNIDQMIPLLLKLSTELSVTKYKSQMKELIKKPPLDLPKPIKKEKSKERE